MFIFMCGFRILNETENRRMLGLRRDATVTSETCDACALRYFAMRPGRLS